MRKDNVNHPEHYISDNYEVIDIIEEFTKDLEGIIATDTGNVIKYILRWSNKNGLEDLEKARWYLNHLIAKVEEKYGDPDEDVIKIDNTLPNILGVAPIDMSDLPSIDEIEGFTDEELDHLELMLDAMDDEEMEEANDRSK